MAFPVYVTCLVLRYRRAVFPTARAIVVQGLIEEIRQKESLSSHFLMCTFSGG